MWAFKTIESAPSTPSHIQRHSGRIIAEPAIAASTCSHTPSRRAIAAIAATGSMAVEAVVPVVATIAAGTTPRARSSAIAAASAAGSSAWEASVATARRFTRPKPASNAAFSTELCACAE